MLSRAARTDSLRRYPPVLLLAIAVSLAALALPSSLVLPQASPTQTLEYAPVPPNGQAPPGGDFSGLGLGTSSTLGADLTGGVLPPPGSGSLPSSFDCAGSPPRQTEDPMSPPCVPFFSGDNGGSTYPGVTRSEIRIVVHDTGGYQECCSSQGTETSPTSTLEDLWRPPPSSGDYVDSRGLRVLQAYFNSRYQAYGRRLHLYVFYDDGNPPTAASREADATDNIRKVQPFAAFIYSAYGVTEPYQDAMAEQGILAFGGSDLRTASYYAKFPKLIWGFLPSVEERAESFAAYACSKVKPYPVSSSGNGDLGQPRKYGLLYTTDASHPEITTYAMTAKRLLEGCGISFGNDVASYPVSGYAVAANATPGYAAANMAQFARDKVTTILWPGGYESNMSRAAAGIGYYPEWILGGGGNNEGSQQAAYQNSQEWKHAFLVTPVLPAAKDGNGTQACEEAVRSVDRSYPSLDMFYACQFYEDLRQLATGIQAAGPRLTPDNLDQGFHAIPPHVSTSPTVAACYYDPGDYTCVKDDMAEWFDPTCPQAWALGGSGDWRMMQNGRRYTRAAWTHDDISAEKSGSDPCNTYNGGVYASTST